MLKYLQFLPLLSLAVATPAFSHQLHQPDASTASSEQRALLDEALSFFLLEALTARSRLRQLDLGARADRFWGSAAELGAIVRGADADDAAMFLPILDGFRRTLADAMPAGTIDQQALGGMQEALDDQIRLHSAAGAFPDAKGMVEVEVRALRNGEAVNNLYVSLDLFGAVPRGPSANTLASVTSPARGIVGPGRYLIRLRSSEGEVARRDVRIGTTGRKEQIDVLVDP